MFLLNIKELLLINGLLILSVILMVTPGVFITLNNKYNFKKVESIIIILIPLIFINYIYFIKMGLPVGYQDTYLHIFQFTQIFNESGKIIFENAQNTSYNFVGIYILYSFLTKIINLDLISIVPLISPFLNLFMVLTVYLIGSKLVSIKIGLLSMVFFGWNYQIITFGNDMRTQTIGVFFIFLFLAFIIIFKEIKSQEISKNITLILLLFSIVVTSFVSIIYTFILTIGILLSSIIYSKYFNGGKQDYKFTTLTMFSLFFVFFVFYLIYIGIGFDNIISSVVNLFIESIKENGSAIVTGPSGLLYGNFVFYTQRIFYLLFFIFSIFVIREIFLRKNYACFVIFGGLYSLFLYFILNALTGTLSSARVYIVSFILIALIISIGLIKTQNLFKNKKATTGFVYVIIIIFALSNVLHFPAYVVGETNPLRYKENIDGVYYWHSNIAQYEAAKFLNFTSNKKLRIDMIITNHLVLSNVDFNNLTMISSQKTNLDKNSLIILHDKFRGQNYTYRNRFPEFKDYEKYNKLYTNDDYVIYEYL